MNVKELLIAIKAIESERNISKDVVLSALQDALAKAYRKHIEIPDALVRVDIDEKTGEVNVYQQYSVVETVEDDELEVSLEMANRRNADLVVGDFYEEKVSIDDLGRAAALLAKNVMKQKIREAEKFSIYQEYIDKLDEMVIGQIESVEEKFIVVNLGKTLAMMPKAAQMPNERYVEGQKMRVVITEVNRETKGAQVLVSRADAKLVKRLFEREVPEIYQGIVEIKAIAREPGERTKMAVSSKRSDVDPIGACIGPRGQRVQVVIEELKGEKIDIFEWSENIPELIKNALSPAQILAVFPTEEKRGLMVVVDDNQLSLAIGKKGKNARLAVRLTGLKIDIKSRTDVEEKNIDWQGRFSDYLEELKVKDAEKRQKALDDETAAENARLAEIAQKQAEQEAIRFAQNEAARTAREALEAAAKEAAAKVVEIVETKPPVIEPVTEVVKPVEAAVEKEVEKPLEKAVEQPIEKKEPEKRVKREIKERKDYVSRFEKLASAPKTVEKKKEDFRKKRKEETEARINVAELLKTKDYDIKPTYSDEEWEEIRRLEEEEAKKTWIEDEIDFDEFDEYYDTE
jgi:transcription termination/antitermination protein NusA